MKDKPCALCGNIGKLTFEHIPPRCAFNNKLIHVQKHEHLMDENNLLFGKKMRSHKGFGKQSLCASCNNSTGNWYAKDFCEFAEQGMKILHAKKDPYVVSGDYVLKPQNVLKQILMMFISVDSSGALRNLDGVVDYLMDKTSIAFPEDIDIYIYSNHSPFKRMVGYCVVGDINRDEIYRWSEINYQPFGYFLTIKSPPPNEYMVKITDFKNIPFDKSVAMTLNTMYLKVGNIIIGQYENLKQE